MMMTKMMRVVITITQTINDDDDDNDDEDLNGGKNVVLKEILCQS